MAEFINAYEKMIRNEGGYKLHIVRGDRGGQTYAGISRNHHPQWPGWRHIDNNDLDNLELTQRVREFYRKHFWDRIDGDQINDQSIAHTLFDFAVNAGCRTAVKLAQLVLGATPDGIVGPQTLEKLNQIDGDAFSIRYCLAKVARYAEIVNRDRSQAKFLLGWINRTLKALPA